MAPQHGNLNVTEPFTNGTTAYYSCKCNKLSGDLVRHCLDDFTWSGTEPVCLPGKIHVLINRTLVMNYYICYSNS